MKQSKKKEPVIKPVIKPQTKPTTAKPKQLEPVDAVIMKYQLAGWDVIKAPRGSINNIIAHNANKLHFIQINNGGVDQTGLAKNTFIQNAFSNGAIPVFATVTPNNISLQDINLNTRVVIGKKKVVGGNTTVDKTIVTNKDVPANKDVSTDKVKSTK